MPHPEVPPKGGEEIVATAIEALGINVPIYRYEIKGKTVTFWLYGHREPVSWTDRTRKRRGKS